MNVFRAANERTREERDFCVSPRDPELGNTEQEAEGPNLVQGRRLNACLRKNKKVGYFLELCVAMAPSLLLMFAVSLGEHAAVYSFSVAGQLVFSNFCLLQTVLHLKTCFLVHT